MKIQGWRNTFVDWLEDIQKFKEIEKYIDTKVFCNSERHYKKCENMLSWDERDFCVKSGRNIKELNYTKGCSKK